MTNGTWGLIWNKKINPLGLTTIGMLVKDYYYGRILTYSAKLIRKVKESEQKRAVKNIVRSELGCHFLVSWEVMKSFPLTPSS